MMNESIITATAPAADEIIYLSGEEIYPNPRNPRGTLSPDDVQDLVEDFRVTRRILQPLTVLPSGMIVIGHRRHLAGLIVGFTSFPCIVREMTEAEQLRTMMTENMKRRDLNPIQEAKGYRDMIEVLGTASAVARELQVQPQRILQTMRLLDLSADIQQLFARGRLPLSAGEILLGIEDEQNRLEIALHAARSDMSVRGLKNLVGRKINPRPKKPNRDERLPDPGHMLRTEVTELLDAQRGTSIRIGHVISALDKTMCLCADAENPEEEKEICNSCPFSRFLNKLWTEVNHAG